MKWLKDNWTGILVLILFVVIILQRCSDGKTKESIKDTLYTYNSDTQYIKQETVYLKEYIPGKTIVIPGNPKPGSSFDSAKLVEMYDLIAKDYYSKKGYLDSIVLMDSSGKKVGIVNVSDTIAKNDFIARKVDYQLQFPIITNTITKTYPQDLKRQLYLGLGITGNQNSLVNGANVSFIYRDKRERLYFAQMGPVAIDGVKIQYSIGTAWKLHLGK